MDDVRKFTGSRFWKQMPGMGINRKTHCAIAMVCAMAICRCVFADPPAGIETSGSAPFSAEAVGAEFRVHPVGSRPMRLPPVPAKPFVDPTTGLDLPPMKWWTDRVTQQVHDRDRWVSFDLETLLLDTLANSPRIKSVGYQTSATFQRIVQQDAVFDSTMLLSTDLGATNDPVGNILTTGGSERLREKSLNFIGGVRKTTRRGTELDLSQQLGFLDSNSTFFIPKDQGNARLSLSLTKPLLSRGGRYYNERLVTQACIESRVAWQDMRGEVEKRVADVIAAYWQLYEVRAQLTQQRELLSRSREIERLLVSRKNFDAALIEITKAKQRVARRGDQVIDLEAELQTQQARLASLVGSDALIGVERDLELIPTVAPVIPTANWALRDAVAQALENRPEVRAATHDVELSALEMRVSRVELEPQLNWVFNAYLSQLNGASQVVRSLGEQFEYAPGVASALEFELPVGRRASRAKSREAIFRARERSERLREAIQQTKFDVETALIQLDRFGKQLVSKRNVLSTAIVEENILTVQWRIIGGDDSRVGIKLENLLDAQRRRTDAEKDLVAVESDYMIALVQLQRAMGTLLINEGIRPHQQRCYGEIDFLRDDDRGQSLDGVGEVITNPRDAETLESVETGEGVIEQLPPPAGAVDDTPVEIPAPRRPALRRPAPIEPSGSTKNSRTNASAIQQTTEKTSPPKNPTPPDRTRRNLQSPVNSNVEAAPPMSPIRNQNASVSQRLSTGNTTQARPQLDLRGPSDWRSPTSRLQMPAYSASGTPPAEPRSNRGTWQSPARGWAR